MKFSDPIDQGSHLAQVHIDAAVAAHASKVKPEQKQIKVIGPDGKETLTWEITECVDCGLDIEPGRLDMARIRCFHCQTSKEKKDAQRF